MPFLLQVKCQSWKRPNNSGMFDYTEKQLVQNNLMIQQDGNIFRSYLNYQIIFIPNSKLQKFTTKLNYQLLAYIICDGKQFKIVDSNQDNNECLYKILSTNQEDIQNHLKIKQNHTIKIGKLSLDILRIKSQKKLVKDYYQNNKIEDGPKFQQQISKIQTSDFPEEICNSQLETNPFFCRYCYSKAIQNNNPLINLCKCQGSAKFTHTSCLMEWVKKRTNLIQDEKKGLFCGQMKGFSCQICHTVYKLDKIFEYLSPKPYNQYLMIKINTHVELLYILDLSGQINRQFYIGRNNQCDISINQSSVSRKHCKITYDYKDKTLTLVDLKSKFGTVSKVINNQIFVIQNVSKFQKGRTIMTMTKIKKKGLFSYFFCNNEEDNSSYKKKQK